MSTTILKGNIISASAPEKLDIIEHGYLVAENGIIQGIFQTLPESWHGCEIEDYGSALIMQSFADLHLHAPQYPMLGMGMDLPLLDWLTTYAFPTEACFKDNEFARMIYHQLAGELVKKGTTRVSMFSSLHREATLILMDELEKAGITGYVGKVNMDRNSSPELEETTDESISETIRWLDQCDFEHIKPIITPRFTPSCSNRLMEALGQIAAERNVPIQSHLSENASEIAWVKELHPDCEQYWESYRKYGLWNSRTLMAHCVWSDERERQAMKDAGVTVVHCAASNQNIVSGCAPVRVMMNEGLKVALGSDIAGGDSLSMQDTIANTIRVSKTREMLDNWETPFLTVTEAFYLGTSGGAEFFGQKPGFAPGNSLHAIALADDKLPCAHPLTVQERLERSIYFRQPNAIQAVWSEGRKII